MAEVKKIEPKKVELNLRLYILILLLFGAFFFLVGLLVGGFNPSSNRIEMIYFVYGGIAILLTNVHYIVIHSLLVLKKKDLTWLFHISQRALHSLTLATTALFAVLIDLILANVCFYGWGFVLDTMTVIIIIFFNLAVVTFIDWIRSILFF